MGKWSVYKLSELRDKLMRPLSGVRFRALDVRLLLIGQKRKLVKPVSRAFYFKLARKTKME